MMKVSEVRLPPRLLFGSTPLPKIRADSVVPTVEEVVRLGLGIRQINSQCIEMDSYASQVKSGSAHAVGFIIVLAVATSCLCAAVLDHAPSLQEWLSILITPWIGVVISYAIYLWHRSILGSELGTLIRLHRGTRKLYHVAPKTNRLVTLDWNPLEAFAGYIPIISQSGFTSRHPLYLIGFAQDGDVRREYCISCGNLGFRDNGQSARELWAYLLRFMDQGPAGLTTPPPLEAKLKRWPTFCQPYQKFWTETKQRFSEPGALWWSPFTLVARLIWFLVSVFPESIAAMLDYKRAYAPFPPEVEAICGFESQTEGRDGSRQ